MQRTFKIISSVVIFTAVFALGLVSSVQGGQKCDEATLEGSYGFLITGTNFQLGKLAGNLGIFAFDGRGNVSVNATLTLQGVVTQRMISTKPEPRLYNVNPDCTGALLTVDGKQPAWEFVIVDNGKGILFTFVGGGRSGNGFVGKQPTECTTASLIGHYGRLLNGTRFDLGGSIAVNQSTVVFDGKGNYELPTDTHTIDGVVSRDPGQIGTYTVNANCTGTIFDEAGKLLFDFVIVDDANEIKYISIEGDRSMTGVSKKQ